MKRRVKWKSSYKGPGDNKSRYVKLGAAAAAVLAVLAAGSLMISHFAGKDGTHQDGVIEILGEDVSHGTKEQTSEAAEADEPSEASLAEENGSEAETVTDFSAYDLEKDTYPQVNEVVGAYFQAKIDQDPAALYQVFGKADDGNMDYYKKALKEEAVYVQDYQDVTCYTRKGLTEDSFVVYVTYDVKFNRVDTLAPGIMWCYVAKDESGSYKIRENVIGEEADYVAEQNRTEGIRLLNRQVKAELKEAIESDTLLAGVYKGLSNGAIVTGDDSAQEGSDSQVQILEGGISTDSPESQEAAEEAGSGEAEAEADTQSSGEETAPEQTVQESQSESEASVSIE